MPRIPPRLMADAMLGNLARDLRLLGYDTAFAGRMPDAALLRTCQAQSRILVTRDRALVQRARGLDTILIRSPEPDEQAFEALGALTHLPAPTRCRSRCLACNGILHPRAGSAVRDRTPDHILATRNDFLECNSCGRVYWEGSHSERLRERCILLQRALQSASHRV